MSFVIPRFVLFNVGLQLAMSNLRKIVKLSTKEILEQEIKNHKTNNLGKRKRYFLSL